MSSADAYPTNYTVLDVIAQSPHPPPVWPPTRHTSPAPSLPQIPPPRSSDSLLPSLPDIRPLPHPATDPSLASSSSLWGAEVPSVLSAAAVAELFPQEAWLRRRVQLPVSVVDLLPALHYQPVAEAAWMQVVARYRLPNSMLSHRLQVESGGRPGGANHDSRRGAPRPTLHATAAPHEHHAWVAYAVTARSPPA